jgi:hypothetical protein
MSAIHPGKERKTSLNERSKIRSAIRKWVLENFEVTGIEALSIASESMMLVPCPAIVGETAQAYIDRASRKRIAYINNNPGKFGNDQGEIEITAEPSEPDLEDAYNAIDSITFIGSEKQINWARSIATKNSEQIASAWKKKDFKLPTSAKWWIENRENIYSALVNQ